MLKMEKKAAKKKSPKKVAASENDSINWHGLSRLRKVHLQTKLLTARKNVTVV